MGLYSPIYEFKWLIGQLAKFNFQVKQTAPGVHASFPERIYWARQMAFSCMRLLLTQRKTRLARVELKVAELKKTLVKIEKLVS